MFLIQSLKQRWLSNCLLSNIPVEETIFSIRIYQD